MKIDKNKITDLIRKWDNLTKELDNTIDPDNEKVMAAVTATIAKGAILKCIEDLKSLINEGK